QYPPEIPGVSVGYFLRASVHAARPDEGGDTFDFQEKRQEGRALLEMAPAFAQRSVSEAFSGAERKRTEVLPLARLEPSLAVLAETDSGLDIDALKVVSSGVNKLHAERPEMSFLVITHYQRILNYIRPTHVHVMVEGKIARSGGFELAE